MKAYDPFKDFDITFSGIDHRGTAEITQPMMKLVRDWIIL